MKTDLKGLCKLNKKGILRLYGIYQDQIPLIKRHAENILNNRDSKIQYGNAIYLSSIIGIDLNEIIESY
jgi:hypothetical protein